MTTVTDFKYTHDEFEEILDNANIGASTDVETDFVDDMIEKFQEYGMDTYVSQKQLDWLLKLTDKVK